MESQERMKAQIERNVARLSMVLTVNRTQETQWNRELTIDVLGTQRISCVAGRGYCVPHGRDSDLVVGLVNAYITQGMPADRTVRLKVNELVRLSGLAHGKHANPGGKIYAQVNDSLNRLFYATYSIKDCWWDAGKEHFVEVKFRIIDDSTQSQVTTERSFGRFMGESELVLTLSKVITKSIQAGHLRALNPEIHGKLDQPLARTLYRTLEEVRAPLGHTPMSQYQVPLMDWGLHLGVMTSNAVLAPNRVRRNLEPAHENLIEAGYLRQVEFDGRGQNMTVRYHFNDLATLPHPKMVAELTTRGVTHPRAVTLAQQYGEARVTEAVKLFEGIRARGPLKNAGGMLSDILANPSKYRVSDDVLPTVKPSVPQRLLPTTITVPDAPVPDPVDEWATLTPEAAMTRAKTLLGMLKLDDKDLKVFLQATSSGRLSGVQAYQVVDALIKCRYAMASQVEVNAELHRQLAALLGEG